jgi:hypothetical protein
MLKKSLIFGSVALFLAALITLTGCPTSVDDEGSSGTVYAHRIYGKNVDPYQAQEAIDRAVAAGEPIALEDRLTISTGHLNFKNARVIINGEVTFTNGVMSVADASVEWAEGASLILGTGSYIYRRGTDTSKITNPNTLVEYVDSLDAIQSTATKVGVRRFKLGPVQDLDYSTGVGINPKAKGTNLVTIFVLDELIIPSEGRVPSGTDIAITAMGTVDVTGLLTEDVVVGGTGLSLGSCSTLTSSQGSMNIYVPAGPTTIHNIDVREGRPFAITQKTTAGTLKIGGKLTGKGTLEVKGGVTDITIEGGDGSVWFSGAANPGTITIKSTGTVTFDQAVTGLTAASSIAGDVVFKGNVSSAEALNFGGNVTLLSAGTLKLTNSSGASVSLAPNKTIRLAITPTPAGSSTSYADILTAGPAGVELAFTQNATLTAANAPTKNDAASIDAAKKLTLSTAGIDIPNGTLQVAPGAALELNAQTLAAETTATQSGFLALADGSKLILTSTGSLTIGDTGIATASTLTAVGGVITLGNNTIEGSDPGTKLEAPAKSGTAGTAPLFTVATLKYLTLKQVDLNLSVFGGLKITGGAYGGVILKDRAKIILNSGEGGKPATGTKITVGANSLALGGDYEALTAPNAAANKETVWSVAQNGGVGEASIIAGAADVTLGKTPAATFTN